MRLFLLLSSATRKPVLIYCRTEGGRLSDCDGGGQSVPEGVGTRSGCRDKHTVLFEPGIQQSAIRQLTPLRLQLWTTSQKSKHCYLRLDFNYNRTRLEMRGNA